MKLVIVDTDIHTDAEGRYSLNDLHKAAGGEERHRPRHFLAAQQTRALIDAISNSPDLENGDRGIPLSVKKGGHNQGSYGAKEQVYA